MTTSPMQRTRRGSCHFRLIGGKIRLRPTSVRQTLSLRFTYPPQMGGLTHLNDHVKNRAIYTFFFSILNRNVYINIPDIGMFARSFKVNKDSLSGVRRKLRNDPRDVVIDITRNHRRDPLEKIEKAFGIPKYRYFKKLLEQIENKLHKSQIENKLHKSQKQI